MNNLQRYLFPNHSNLTNVLDEISKSFNQMPKYPPMDIYETKNGEHVIEIATTFKVENINIDVQDNIISISGKNEDTKENIENEQNYIYKTISKKSFQRTFKTDYIIDKDSVQALMENGLLRITFKPKIEAVENKTNIKIQVK